MNPLAPVLCATLPGALCAGAHYFPWRFWFKRGRLPRLWAYVCGLLAILLPATVAALLAALSVYDALALVWLATVSAGLGTALPWWHDSQKRAEYQRADDLAGQLERDEFYGE
jgi:hypothetical protein